MTKKIIRAFCWTKQEWVTLEGFQNLTEARMANPGLTDFEYAGWEK